MHFLLQMYWSLQNFAALASKPHRRNLKFAQDVKILQVTLLGKFRLLWPEMLQPPTEVPQTDQLFFPRTNSGSYTKDALHRPEAN